MLETELLNDFVGQDRFIVPSGDFCLAAALLKKVGIRNISLPFDWSICPIHVLADIHRRGILVTAESKYLTRKGGKRWSHFLYSSMNRGSTKIEYNFFLHQDPIDSDGSLNQSYSRRLSRLNYLIKNANCLLFNVHVCGFAKGQNILNFHEIISCYEKESRVLSLRLRPSKTYLSPRIVYSDRHLMILEFGISYLNSFTSSRFQQYVAGDLIPDLWRLRAYQAAKGVSILCPLSSASIEGFLLGLKDKVKSYDPLIDYKL